MSKSPDDESLTFNQRLDILVSRVMRLESRLEQVERQSAPKVKEAAYEDNEMAIRLIAARAKAQEEGE